MTEKEASTERTHDDDAIEAVARILVEAAEEEPSGQEGSTDSLSVCRGDPLA